jgi:hypothetical protein
MTLQLTPESGVLLSRRAPKLDLKDRAAACAKTIELLTSHGMETDASEEDRDTAAALAVAYAQNPDSVSKKVTTQRNIPLTPAVLRETHKILDEFGRQVVDSALTVRYLVTNKLILETENPDARVRMKALELLGKMSDVGLFTEKSEVTITHQTTDDLKEKLRKKLQRLTAPQAEPDIEDAVIIDGESIDVDAALGITDE